MTRKEVTNEFIAGLKEVVDSQKPAAQQETDIVGSMQEENVAIGDAKTVKEQERQVELAKTRRSKQKKALENVKKQQIIEEGQARFNIEKAARNERFADPAYAKKLKHSAEQYLRGNVKGLSADEKNDLSYLHDLVQDDQRGGVAIYDKTFYLAAEVFSPTKEEEEIPEKEEKKPGFWARLLGRKK